MSKYQTVLKIYVFNVKNLCVGEGAAFIRGQLGIIQKASWPSWCSCCEPATSSFQEKQSHNLSVGQPRSTGLVLLPEKQSHHLGAEVSNKNPVLCHQEHARHLASVDSDPVPSDRKRTPGTRIGHALGDMALHQEGFEQTLLCNPTGLPPARLSFES